MASHFHSGLLTTFAKQVVTVCLSIQHRHLQLVENSYYVLTHFTARLNVTYYMRKNYGCDVNQSQGIDRVTCFKSCAIHIALGRLGILTESFWLTWQNWRL